MARTFGKHVDDEDEADCRGAEGGRRELEEIQEEAEEGTHLYLGFVIDQIRRNSIEVQPEQLQRYVSPLESQIGEARILDWSNAGRELRQLADAFSQSAERERVRRRAQDITFDSLDSDHFFELLQELFQGEGVTRERILVLFFFCADVAIEALRKGFSQTFHHLMQWTLKYIATRVARWVHEHGGWGAVLRSSLTIAYQVSACCAFVAVAFACFVYIRRNL